MKHFYKIITIILCFVLFTACGGNNIQMSVNENSIEGSDLSSGNEEVASQENTSPLDMAKAGNSDTVAWLRIPNTDIDNPVMQSTNNEDYLRRNENGEYDIWGCYFADYYSNLTSKDSLLQNTVIYGHSESSENPDGKRFTQLFRYLDLDFLKANPIIYLTIDDEELPFQIFGVFFTNTDFYYIDPNPSDQGFDSFMAEVNAKNEFVFDGISVSEQDKLLTLSVCAYRYDTAKTGNHRLVVMAKLVEDQAQVPNVTANSNPKRP